jgi:hypothetical protein
MLQLVSPLRPFLILPNNKKLLNLKNYNKLHPVPEVIHYNVVTTTNIRTW